jgi:pullulanase/glycogen debranching enzyme
VRLPAEKATHSVVDEERWWIQASTTWKVIYPHRPAARTIVYEIYISSFTQHCSSGVLEKIRAYASLIDKVPYLQERGITRVRMISSRQGIAQAGISVSHFPNAEMPSGVRWTKAPL